MKIRNIVAIAFITPLALVSCVPSAGAENEDDSPGGVIVEQMPNGKKVYCVAWKTAQGVSIDCNWDAYNNIQTNGA